jgi:hypothetical protein
MSNVADRVRQHRARRKAGRAVLLVEVDVHALAEVLVDDAKLLGWDECEDTEAIARATSELLEIFIMERTL